METSRNMLCIVYSQGIITDRQIRNWLAKFQSEETLLEDESRQEPSLDFDDEALTSLVEINPQQRN